MISPLLDSALSPVAVQPDPNAEGVGLAACVLRLLIARQSATAELPIRRAAPAPPVPADRDALPDWTADDILRAEGYIV